LIIADLLGIFITMFVFFAPVLEFIDTNYYLDADRDYDLE